MLVELSPFLTKLESVNHEIILYTLSHETRNTDQIYNFFSNSLWLLWPWYLWNVRELHKEAVKLIIILARAISGETACSDWCIARHSSPVMPTGIMRLLMPGFWTDWQFQKYKQTNAD